MERWRSLDALLAGPQPARAVQRAREGGELSELLPELEAAFGFDQRSPYHAHDVGSHLLAVLDEAARLTADPDIRLAALLHDVGKPASFWTDESGRGHFYRDARRPGSGDHAEIGAELVSRRLAELGYPADRVDRVTELVRHHMARFSTRDGARRFLERVGDPGLGADVLLLRETDERGKRPEATAEDVARMRELLADAISSQADPATAGG